MTMMRAVHATAIGGPEVLQPATVRRPEPGPDEVLVRLTYAGVAYNDYMIRTDFYRHPGASAPEMPLILGEEGAGTVEQVGSDVSGFTPGQRVGFLSHGTKTYAEYSAVPAARLFSIPDDISDERSIALTHAGLAARALLHAYHPVSEDSVVLVTGASGSVGSLLVEWGSRLGATIIATVTSSASGEWVKQLGASVVINVSEQEVLAETQRATDGRGVDLALDSVGGEGFHQVFDSLTTRGIVVPFGVAGGKYPPIDPLSLIDRSRVIAGFMFFDFMGTASELAENITTVFDASRQGWMTPAIADVFPLEKAADAHRAFERRGRKGKILLKI